MHAGVQHEVMPACDDTPHDVCVFGVLPATLLYLRVLLVAALLLDAQLSRMANLSKTFTMACMASYNGMHGLRHQMSCLAMWQVVGVSCRHHYKISSALPAIFSNGI